MNKLVGDPDGATPLEPEEMKGLLHKHVTMRSELDELEQFNIQEGLKWQSNTGPFSVAFACLHSEVASSF